MADDWTDEARRRVEELGRRYVNLVYGAAVRQMGGEGKGAEDVTQAVFLVAMRKAKTGGLPEEGRMAGWLLKVTRYAVKEAKRAAGRRRMHEERAARERSEMTEGSEGPGSEGLRGAMDEALLKLGELDREVVVRRYLRGEAVGELAQAVGMAENAASQRIGRALEKLRKVLARRGVIAPAAALAAVMMAEGAKAAPAGLAASAAGVTGGASTAAVGIAKGAGLAMEMAMIKMTMMAICVVLGIGVAVAAVVNAAAGAQQVPATSRASATAPATQVTNVESAMTQRSKGSFASEIQEALQIPRTNADVLKPLAAAVWADMTNTDVVQPAIHDLVDALLAGPDPDALVKKILPTVDIEFRTGSQDGVPGWAYGTYWARVELCDHLWKLATTSADATQAQRLARATVMFAAMNDYQAGWLKIAAVLKDEDSFRQIAGLDDTQFAKLKAVVDERLKQLKEFADNETAALRRFNKINAAAGADISRESVKAALANFDDAFRKGPRQNGCRWRVLSESWELLNSLRLHENSGGQELVRQQLGVWKHDFPDPDIVRWIGQALERKGTPPEKLIRDFKVNERGETVEVEGPVEK